MMEKCYIRVVTAYQITTICVTQRVQLEVPFTLMEAGRREDASVDTIKAYPH